MIAGYSNLSQQEYHCEPTPQNKLFFTKNNVITTEGKRGCLNSDNTSLYGMGLSHYIVWGSCVCRRVKKMPNTSA